MHIFINLVPQHNPARLGEIIFIIKRGTSLCKCDIQQVFLCTLKRIKRKRHQQKESEPYQEYKGTTELSIEQYLDPRVLRS